MKMKKTWEVNNNSTKEIEERCKAMNNAIGLNNIKLNDNKLQLHINAWCSEHIKTLHKEYPSTEWLAICKIEPQGNWEFIMTDMIFPHQKWVGWEVETTQEWMDWAVKELVERKEDLSKWNCILHSHHSMWVFWSGTDDNARLWLNDWRTMAWAVVSAYKWEEISYKGCLNFYKPYNIEIDCEIDTERPLFLECYSEFQTAVSDLEQTELEKLIAENKERIEELSKTPDYTRLLEYVGIDISNDLVQNYETIKDKVELDLSNFLLDLKKQAYDNAYGTVIDSGEFDLNEYDEYCTWSDNLLSQLGEHREKSYSYSGSLYSTTKDSIDSYAKDDLRNFETYNDYYYDDYEFTSPKYSESVVRQMFCIPSMVPMKTGIQWEREVWVEELWEYLYVENYENYKYSY